MTILRPRYEEKIKNLLGTPLIKVFTGMRRSGKTYLMRRTEEILRTERMVAPKNMIYINKEDFAFHTLRTAEELQTLITNTFVGVAGKKYIFIDEVQEIQGWEKVIRSYGAQDEEYEIFITGSNASLLSGELATLLTGRFLEIVVHPLSFQEFRTFLKNSKTPEDDFLLFLRYGSLPGIHTLPLTDENIRNYLSGVFSSILLKDIVQRFEIRNASFLQSLFYYLAENIGNIVSTQKIHDFLLHEHIPLSLFTIREYLGFFQNAFLLQKVKRFDLKGKKLLEVHEKYYVNDIGMRSFFLGFQERDTGRVIENIVYAELKIRGYDVYVGKIREKEIDFLAEKNGEKILIQVAYDITNPATKEREISSLLTLSSPIPRLLLSMSRFEGGLISDVPHKYLLDWLLKK